MVLLLLGGGGVCVCIIERRVGNRGLRVCVRGVREGWSEYDCFMWYMCVGWGWVTEAWWVVNTQNMNDGWCKYILYTFYLKRGYSYPPLG